MISAKAPLEQAYLTYMHQVAGQRWLGIIPAPTLRAKLSTVLQDPDYIVDVSGTAIGVADLERVFRKGFILVNCRRYVHAYKGNMLAFPCPHQQSDLR